MVMQYPGVMNQPYYPPSWQGMPWSAYAYPPENVYQQRYITPPTDVVRMPALPQPPTPPVLNLSPQRPLMGQTQPAPDRAKHLALAAGLLTIGWLLRRPEFSHESSFKYISSKPADWAKIGLGVAAVNQFNQAFGWKPPAWLSAIETAAIINPMLLPSGFSRRSAMQTLIMAPLIALIVLGTGYLNKNVIEPLNEKYHLPAPLTRLGLTIGMLALGVRVYPQIYEKAATTGLMGQEAKILVEKASTQALTGDSMAVCSTCGGNHIICMTDIADFFGGMVNWLKSMSTGSNTTPQPHRLEPISPASSLQGIRFGHEVHSHEADHHHHAHEHQHLHAPKTMGEYLVYPLQAVGLWVKEFVKNLLEDIRFIFKPEPI
jgi:hypothetical protein